MAQVLPGGRLKLTKKDYRSSGTRAFSAAGQDGLVDLAEFDRPGIVLSSIGARCGKCFYAAPPWTTLANTQAILPSADRCDPGFLFQYVNDEDYWHRSGSAQPFIAPSTIKKAWVALPPLPEQRKIAAILSSVDETMEKAEAVIAQLDVVKKAMLEELLTRGIPGRHSRFKKTEIGEVPEAWAVVPMELVALKPSGMVGGPFGSDLTASDYVETPGVPVIRGSDVSPGRFQEHDLVYVSTKKADDLRKNAARRGDLIMTQRGASLGDATLIPESSNYEDYIVSQTMMRMTPDHSKVLPRFLLHWVCSQSAQSWLQRRAIGNAQPHLNLTIFREMPAIVPPLTEQQRIADIVDSVDAAIATNRREHDAQRRAKCALGSVLLAGEVRVTSDVDIA